MDLFTENVPNAAAATLTLPEQLEACRMRAESLCEALAAPYPAYTLVFSLSDGARRALVLHSHAPSFVQAWSEGAQACLAAAKRQKFKACWLRVDWVTGATPISWAELQERLHQTQRNDFRLGLALDDEFRRVLTEQELNGNAMLYGGPQATHAQFNRNNFEIYMWRRYAHEPAADFEPTRIVHMLQTRGIFCGPDGQVKLLAASGPAAGRRELPPLDTRTATELIDSSTRYLTRQVQRSGQFVYGHFPCFDRRVSGYNTLRHAATLYTMLEAWEFNRDPALLEAIERAVHYLCSQLIRDYTLSDGNQVSFLVDVRDEIKLGGNGVALLALVKYSELARTREHLPLLNRLALGIGHMQDAQSGRFNHVLSAKDLSIKQATRTLYYDGEAAFGLMRLYAFTRDARWLQMVEHAFDHFIQSDHWQAHDHWMACCVDELTRWRPLEKYFRFGVQNIADYLDFVLERETPFPTLLELMLATRRMLRRLDAQPALRYLARELDMDKFERALDHRANMLLNGYNWPEMAMYFRKPGTLMGSFFMRQHSFRVRIDDVAHHLSGLLDYHALLRARNLERHVIPRLQPVVRSEDASSTDLDSAPAPLESSMDAAWVLGTQARAAWQPAGAARGS